MLNTSKYDTFSVTYFVIINYDKAKKNLNFAFLKDSQI